MKSILEAIGILTRARSLSGDANSSEYRFLDHAIIHLSKQYVAPFSVTGQRQYNDLSDAVAILLRCEVLHVRHSNLNIGQMACNILQHARGHIASQVARIPREEYHTLNDCKPACPCGSVALPLYVREGQRARLQYLRHERLRKERVA